VRIRDLSLIFFHRRGANFVPTDNDWRQICGSQVRILELIYAPKDKALSHQKPIDLTQDQQIESLKQQAIDLARTVDAVRLDTLKKSNERIELLEQKARDMAWFVETTRQQTLLQSDRKIEALEQKARDLADFVETLRNQTRLQTETEIEALGQKARDLALFVETVRKETRVRSEAEIASLGQRARDLAVSTESVREKTLLQSDKEIATLGRRALDLAASVEAGREKALQRSDIEIAALGKQARDLAVTVEAVREETLQESHAEIEELKQKARNLAASVEKSRIDTLIESDRVTRKLNEELEQRVLERTGQLEAANKELEFFSYSVSHDLRAPLRAIGGFSRILLEEHAAALPQEAREYLKLVCENTSQMGRLVDDLLAFSRLGRQGLTKHTVDPRKIVHLCLQDMQHDLQGRQIEMVIGDLQFCHADPTLLKQVWTNLLSNAIKYTSKRDSARIEIGCRKEMPFSAGGDIPSGTEMEAVYFVKDDGAGFDMKYADKLFGVFQRLHRASEYEGTGVGLAIVQRIINRHGGRIWGQAQVNQGATFFFTLE
jgi:signal transduction histidine kinase